jgi:hypothetical protein
MKCTHALLCLQRFAGQRGSHFPRIRTHSAVDFTVRTLSTDSNLRSLRAVVTQKHAFSIVMSCGMYAQSHRPKPTLTPFFQSQFTIALKVRRLTALGMSQMRWCSYPLHWADRRPQIQNLAGSQDVPGHAHTLWCCHNLRIASPQHLCGSAKTSCRKLLNMRCYFLMMDMCFRRRCGVV